jgi:hypothetical protein
MLDCWDKLVFFVWKKEINSLYIWSPYSIATQQQEQVTTLFTKYNRLIGGLPFQFSKLSPQSSGFLRFLSFHLEIEWRTFFCTIRLSRTNTSERAEMFYHLNWSLTNVHIDLCKWMNMKNKLYVVNIGEYFNTSKRLQ